MNEKLAVHGETVLWKPGPDAAAGPMGRFLASASARHVPDEIVAVPGVPVTHAGKKVEVPVKKLFTGADPRSVDRGALAGPDALDWFVVRAQELGRLTVREVEDAESGAGRALHG